TRCNSHEEMWQYDMSSDLWTPLLSQTQANQSGYPRGVCLPSAMYDPRRKVVWVTGGAERAAVTDYYSGLVSGGIWAFDPVARSWSREGPTAQQGESSNVNVAEIEYGLYDPVRDQLVIPSRNGGSGEQIVRYNLAGVTVRDGVQNDNWSTENAAINEPVMAQTPLVYDSTRDVAWFYNVCEGGTPCLNPSKLWTYNLQTKVWTLINTNSIVPNKSTFGMAYVPTIDSIVIFGGLNKAESAPGTTYINELWIYDIQRNQWSKPVLGGAIPTPRKGENMVYDSHNNALMIFGGTGGFQSVGVPDSSGYEGTEVFLLRLSNN
ncbi:MAG: kelch repeat-containing protein, partial [Armatimonadota bacterium]|nr:kelch repeat-containing protein [Armatimonadota bacterium]